MNLREYLTAAARAQDAGTLHSLQADARADESLHSTELDEISRAIDRRFHELNKKALGPGRGKW